MSICNFNVFIRFHKWAEKYEIYGVIRQVAPESKIQLVSCEISPKSLLEISTLEYIRAIDAYIFCDPFHSIILFDSLYIFIDMHAQVLKFSAFQCTLIYDFSGFGKSAIQWSSDPHLKHVFGFRLLRSVRSFLKLRELCELKNESNFLLTSQFLWYVFSPVGCYYPKWLHIEWSRFALSIALTELSKLG